MTKAWPVNGIDPSASLASNARRILAVRIAEYYSFSEVVRDERAVTELHDLRISAKRLRYTLELFGSVFGDFGERQIARVKEVQEHLGAAHDHDVRIGLIEEALQELAIEGVKAISRELAATPASKHGSIVSAALRPPPDDPRRGLIALLARQHAARRQVHRAFVECWVHYEAERMREELVALSLSHPAAEGQ